MSPTLQITRTEHHALMRNIPAFNARAAVLAAEIADVTGCAEGVALIAANQFFAFPFDERMHGMGDPPVGRYVEFSAALSALRKFKAAAMAPALLLAAE